MIGVPLDQREAGEGRQQVMYRLAISELAYAA